LTGTIQLCLHQLYLRS